MQETKLVAVIEPILASHGLELDGLTVIPMGKRRLLRVIVDGDGPAGRGVLLDDIAEASSAISTALDASDAAGTHPYTLEVSSRGVGTPLTEAKHYRRHAGRLVKIRLADDEVTGRIREVNGDTVLLDVGGGNREIPVQDVVKAVVQVELTRSVDDDGEDG